MFPPHSVTRSLARSHRILHPQNLHTSKSLQNKEPAASNFPVISLVCWDSSNPPPKNLENTKITSKQGAAVNNFPITHSLAFIESSTHKRSKPQNRLKQKKRQQQLPNALRLTHSIAHSFTRSHRILHPQYLETSKWLPKRNTRSNFTVSQSVNPSIDGLHWTEIGKQNRVPKWSERAFGCIPPKHPQQKQLGWRNPHNTHTDPPVESSRGLHHRTT